MNDHVVKTDYDLLLHIQSKLAVKGLKEPMNEVVAQNGEQSGN